MPFSVGKIWKDFIDTTLVKVGMFNAFSVVFRVIFAYITNKIIVLYLGPVGTALTEQMRNFVQSLQGISTLGINEGVIRYSALYQSRGKRLNYFLGTTYRLILASSLVLMLIILLFAPRINDFLFSTRDYILLVYLSAFVVPVYAVQVILLSVLQGFQEYKKVTYIITIVHFTGMVLIFILVWQLKMLGALLAVMITPVVSFSVILIFLGKDLKFLLIGPIENGFTDLQKRQYIKRLVPFIWMAGITAIAIPLFTIALRNLIITHFTDEGQIYAGYWDAVRKVSVFYFMFITPVFSMYYFPRLSKLNGEGWWIHIKEMITKFYPFVLSGMLLIYLFRRQVTLFIFSEAYDPMNPLYFWQLSGDLVRLFSLLLAYRFWAKAMVNRYIFSELSYWTLLYVLSYVWIQTGGLTGVMQAYLASNFYYLALMLLIFRNEVR